ncbi:MAG TPA: hypothetical protein VFK94_06640 [Patescibacteria group bacterium]|nr:hypothetical protein [Patescibacteria group bacterium]
MDVTIDDNGMITIKMLASDSGKISSTGNTKQFAYGQAKVMYNGRVITVQVNAYERIR